MTQPQGPEPSLNELLEESRTVLADALTDMSEMRAEMQREAAAHQAERETAEDTRAEQARAGERGPEQQRLQEQIDLGRTTWGAVLSGADESPDAVAVRSQLDENLSTFADQMDEALGEERLAGRPDPRADLKDSFAELRAAVAEIQDLENRMNRGQ